MNRSAIVVTIFTLAIFSIAHAGDWPTWRYDAQRSAASPSELPSKLSLQWVRELPPLKPAWPDQPKLQFDTTLEPIVLCEQLFVASSYDNSVTAYSTRTGSRSWRFFADGPVRFAPLAWQEKLYFVSDDGYLYCLQVQDGKLLWRFRGGPSDRKILGNERIVSAWPARGAPVLSDGTIYFAAGIWPFMGIFLHALDAQTGQVVWTNDGDGSIYIKQPHNTDSFAGVAPQGPLVVIGDKLLIPGGRSVPACYDRKTGRMLYYQLNDNGKKGGGFGVAAVDHLLFNGGAAFDLENESYLGAVGDLLSFADGLLYDYRNQRLRAFDLKPTEPPQQPGVDRKGEQVLIPKWSLRELAQIETPRLTALIKSGSRVYAGCEGHLLAFSLPMPQTGPFTPAWECDVDGTPHSLIAADDRLFAVTQQGKLYCFGNAATASPTTSQDASAKQPSPSDNSWSAKAEGILQSSGVREGYCVVWGVGSGGLINELMRRNDFRLVVIEPDAERANAFRGTLSDAGVGSERVTILVGDPLTIALPPYLANLIVTETASAPQNMRAATIATMFANLRPFGGVACLPIPGREKEALKESMKHLDLANVVWKDAGSNTLLVRDGALPESGNWTHEHADAANTRVSKDRMVKAPLGLLWFGGPSNDAILPRHGHGPQPQVVDGRLLIEGADLLRAMDIYTGRLLWETHLPGLGALYNYTFHQPGANSSGTNYVATPAGIYVTYGQACLLLEPSTGKKLAEFKLPAPPGSDAVPQWGYLNVDDQYLVGGAEPLFDASLAKSRTDNDNYSSSQRLVVLDRKDGEVFWSATAISGFRHNAICLGGGRIYCIDRLSGAQLSRLKRRGDMPVDKPRLVVFDLKSGKEVWQSDEDIFGTWLSYSAEHDILVEAGRVARDALSDEPKGMRAYRASDGSVLWENKAYSGPAMIHHDTILMAGVACNLLTGDARMREHPISGEPVAWSWSRNYGCNTPLASEHLLTFRSGAAGYFDFCNDGGTGNLGGFRSSCTNNLIVAGGLLNAPEYTRTCTCSYQNQTSLALMHMPDVETWTSFGSQTPSQPVRRVGINLGAPGDRKNADGTLWLEYPSVGGSSPTIPVTIDPPAPNWFRRHSSAISGSGLNWVTASGAKGLNSLEVKLTDADGQPRRYTVRLHFVEPDDINIGDRVFQVTIQDKLAFESLDVFQEAGARNRSVVKEVSGVEVNQKLVIKLTPSPHSKEQATVLCGVEIQAEGW